MAFEEAFGRCHVCLALRLTAPETLRPNVPRIIAGPCGGRGQRAGVERSACIQITKSISEAHCEPSQNLSGTEKRVTTFFSIKSSVKFVSRNGESQSLLDIAGHIAGQSRANARVRLSIIARNILLLLAFLSMARGLLRCLLLVVGIRVHICDLEETSGLLKDSETRWLSTCRNRPWSFRGSFQVRTNRRR